MPVVPVLEPELESHIILSICFHVELDSKKFIGVHRAYEIFRRLKCRIAFRDYGCGIDGIWPVICNAKDYALGVQFRALGKCALYRGRIHSYRYLQVEAVKPC